MRIIAQSLALLILLSYPTAVPAQDEDTEEDERETGFVLDNIRATLAFTRGDSRKRNYSDLRVYVAGEAHYTLAGDDYLDMYLLINRLDRSWDHRDTDDPIRNLFNSNINYVFRGVDRDTLGLYPLVGASFFSDDFLNDLNVGLGYGYLYNYDGGSLRALAGAGQNLGYADNWSPMANLGWTHNQRLGGQWRLRTRADVLWNDSRTASSPDDGQPDTILVVDGTLSYDVARGWSLYTRYFNDNASDNARSYISFGISHRYRRPPARR